MEGNQQDRLIVTAASAEYSSSLLALLGSLTLNWPGHPPVRVYDLGLEASTLHLLEESGIAVERVPPFCSHWRRHFTWKLWCLQQAPARDVLWIDASCLVLRPLDETFRALGESG